MKSRKIIYWISTALLILFLIGTGISDVLMIEQVRESIGRLGYPGYLLPFLGVLKILGAIVILLPPLRGVHQGAYAGIFFYGLGAGYSHVAFGDPVATALPGMLVMFLTAASYLSAVKRPQLTLFSNKD